MSDALGMTLRNGKTINMTSDEKIIVEWDGQDYIPDDIFCDFDLEWSVVVRNAMSYDSPWNMFETNKFIGFLYNTTDHWCQKIWHEDVSYRVSAVARVLVDFVEYAKFVAESWNNYPNTRMKNATVDSDINNNIVVMAIEIISEYSLANRIKTTWCKSHAVKYNENFTLDQMLFIY
jgi:hypothetical protein